jgi:hypothetical protein
VCAIHAENWLENDCQSVLSLELSAETLAEAAGVESAHATGGDLANRIR